jgi:hypothetical protein
MVPFFAKVTFALTLRSTAPTDCPQMATHIADMGCLTTYVATSIFFVKHVRSVEISLLSLPQSDDN